MHELEDLVFDLMMYTKTKKDNPKLGELYVVVKANGTPGGWIKRNGKESTRH